MDTESLSCLGYICFAHRLVCAGGGGPSGKQRNQSMGQDCGVLRHVGTDKSNEAHP